MILKIIYSKNWNECDNFTILLIIYGWVIIKAIFKIAYNKYINYEKVYIKRNEWIERKMLWNL